MERIKSLKSLRSLVIVSVVLAVTLISSLTLMEQGEAADPSLTNSEVASIIANAIAQASVEPSLLRVDGDGAQQTTRMHVAVVNRSGKVIGFESMADAWGGSEDIARAKAYTAMAFSSDENALTSRTIGILSQPGGDLWQIGNSNRPNTAGGELDEQGLIEFPGGLPLYDANGRLVGGIGVSGDSVCADENVAEAGTAGFEPPAAIRVDTVLGGAGLYVDSPPGCP